MISHIFTLLFGILMGVGIHKVNIFFSPTETLLSLTRRDVDNLVGGVIVIVICLFGLTDVYKHLRKQEQSAGC